MPRLVYPQLTDISTEAALRKHYASVGERLGRGVVKSVQEVMQSPKEKWAAPQIRELKEQRQKRFFSPEQHRGRIRDVRRMLTDKSSPYDVVVAVATAWNVSVESVCGFCHEEDYVTSRGVAVTLCRMLLGMRVDDIAIVFGHRTGRGVRKQIDRYEQIVNDALASAEGERCNPAR